jgi:hypothetical protein
MVASTRREVDVVGPLMLGGGISHVIQLKQRGTYLRFNCFIARVLDMFLITRLV